MIIGNADLLFEMLLEKEVKINIIKWNNYIRHILFSERIINAKNLNIIIKRMYGKLNERKLNESDYIMSCEKARQ